MLESFDKYGLPKKYVIIGFVGGMLGVLIAYFLDFRNHKLVLFQPHSGQPSAAILADSSAKSAAKTVDTNPSKVEQS